MSVTCVGVISLGTVEKCARNGKISRKIIDDYTEYAKIFKAKGLPYTRYKDGGFDGGIAKFLSDEEKKALIG